MAGAIANTYLTFAAKGIKEELADAIYAIDPEDTPGISMAAKTKKSNTMFEWQTDALESPEGVSNAHLEGDDITTFPAVTPTVRVGNRMQISRKLLLVSGTLQAVDKAGRDDEIAYQTAKRGTELKIDMETIFFANQGADAGGTSTPRKMATLGAWVKTNVDLGTGAAANPSWTSGVPGAGRTDGTQRAFTETILKSVIQKMYASGAKVDGLKLMVGPVNKQKVSGFAGIATKTHNLNGRKPEQGTIVGAADVYVSDFGTLVCVPSRFQRERDAWILNPDFYSLPHLRPFKRVPLAKTGDADKTMLLVEWSLEVRNEKAFGLAADLTTT